uniref:Uncharacterized protein n=1 Tax=Arundo donax TaxID=35708 RepID=A0A0A9FS72_ARUDO
MAVSMREVDPVFQGAGQKDGLEIWRIEKLQAVPVPKESCGKFFTGDSYIILKVLNFAQVVDVLLPASSLWENFL